MNHLSNEEATKTNKIYHSCYTTNTDRTRIRVNFMNGECCVIPTVEKRWKKTEQPRKKSPRKVEKISDVAQRESTYS